MDDGRIKSGERKEGRGNLDGYQKVGPTFGLRNFVCTSLSYILKSRTTEINVIVYFVNSRRFFRVVDDQIVFFALIF